MKHIVNIIPLLAALIVAAACSTPEKHMKKGDMFFARGEYYDASLEYKRAYSSTPAKERDKRGERAFRMAECYRRINNTAKAEGAYRNAVRYNYVDTTTYFYLAEVQRQLGSYRAAEENYKLYLEKNPGHKRSLTGLQSCAIAPQMKEKGSLYTVKSEKQFNSRRSDYCPVLFGENYDRIIFTSTRPQAKGDEDSPITGLKNGDLFTSSKDEKGKWKPVEELQGEVNTELDEGAPGITPDGQTMYLTVCPVDEQYPRCAEIHSSARSDATWAKPVKLEITSDTLSSYAHPAVSPDGQWLYFVSDMPGGLGGMDIWRMQLSEHGAGVIENLGAPINTEGDEMFPTFRPNGDLYFSSNGHVGMGGLDIYRARHDSIRNKWSVEILPSPVNSSGDDFGMTFEGVHNRGYFTSNRGKGRGFDHILSFECPEVVQTVKGWVFEQDGYELVNSTVYMVGNDGTNMKFGVKSDGSFEQVIHPGVKYVLLATCEGFMNYRQELEIDSSEVSTCDTLFFPLPSLTSPVLVRNVFYEFDSATLTDNSKEALDNLTRLLQENPNITIELSSHCDYRGNELYNRKLSQRRAESVVDYLIKQGISPQRLSAVGYGKLRPKVVTKRLAEVYDFLHEGDTLTEKYILKLKPIEQDTCNALNRRTEFRVLRTTYGLFDEQGNLDAKALVGNKNATPDTQKTKKPIVTVYIPTPEEARAADGKPADSTKATPKNGNRPVQKAAATDSTAKAKATSTKPESTPAKADTAAAKAKDVKAKADTAKTKANAAQPKAGATRAKADTAKTKANAANAKADTAKTRPQATKGKPASAKTNAQTGNGNAKTKAEPDSSASAAGKNKK